MELVRPDLAVRPLDPLFDLRHEWVDNLRPPDRTGDRTTGVPHPCVSPHGLGIDPRQHSRRMRTFGGVQGLEDFHDFPVRLLQRPSGRSASMPRSTEPTAGGIVCSEPTRMGPRTGRSVVRGEGSDLSAYRDLGLSALSRWVHPARAGSSAPGATLRGRSRVHPRTRGEQKSNQKPLYRTRGPSPRTRGTDCMTCRSTGSTGDSQALPSNPT